MRHLIWLILTGIVACETIKPYEKEYLLNPLMDDGSVSVLSSGLMSSASSSFERLAQGLPGASSGSSCPTCGG